MLISFFWKIEYYFKFVEMEVGISVVFNLFFRGNFYILKKNNEIKFVFVSELLGIKIWVDSI